MKTICNYNNNNKIRKKKFHLDYLELKEWRQKYWQKRMLTKTSNTIIEKTWINIFFLKKKKKNLFHTKLFILLLSYYILKIKSLKCIYKINKIIII